MLRFVGGSGVLMGLQGKYPRRATDGRPGHGRLYLCAGGKIKGVPLGFQCLIPTRGGTSPILPSSGPQIGPKSRDWMPHQGWSRPAFLPSGQLSLCARLHFGWRRVQACKGAMQPAPGARRLLRKENTPTNGARACHGATDGKRDFVSWDHVISGLGRPGAVSK